MKLNIAVCDDEKAVRDDIAQKIKLLYPETELFLFQNGGELLQSAASFDIIFLDIQMKAPDGMETARLLRKKGSEAALIFVTALQEYVFQAFDVDAFHYLVKPFDKAKFYEVLHAAVTRKQKENEEKERDDGACSDAGAEPGVGSGLGTGSDSPSPKTITLKIGRITSKIYVKDIIYAEVFNRKIVLYTTEGEFEFYGRMNELEKMLGADFFRPHRAYLIQLKYVSKYDATGILLENGQRVLMAKQKYEEFVKKYFAYARRNDG